MTLAQTFGKVLKTRRLACGLSQIELAEKSRLDRTFISLLERGERQPSLNTLFVLAVSLGITSSRLLLDVEKASGGKVRRRSVTLSMSSRRL